MARTEDLARKSAAMGLGVSGIVAALAVAKLLLHFLLNGRYGYWVDELYFIACGEHLDWGYVDQPPLIAVVAKLSRWLLGDSLFALRFFPAVAGALIVFLTGWAAHGLGGGRFAQGLAALAVIVAPVYLGFDNLLTMNAFEPFFWMVCVCTAIAILNDADDRLWLLAGVATGVGVLNKYSMAFFALSLVAGLLLTDARRVFRTRWIWIAGGVAVLIALPHVVWEAARGWPSLELLRNARLYQHQPVSPLEFLWGQIQLAHPLALPLWGAGFVYLLRPSSKRFRSLGWSALLLFVVALVSQWKTYYLAPVYPVLFAAGAVATEQFVARKSWGELKIISVCWLLIAGIITAPYVLPVLPITWVPRYMAAIGIKDVRPERREEGEIPQLFADMFGWEETVATVAKVYESLPPEERSRCGIWAASYGEAGAVDFFGRAYHLPKAVSGYQNYYLWGPGPYTGEVMITINIPGAKLQPWFDRVDLAATVSCEYCMPDRRRVPINICRGLKIPMAEFWPKVKCWTCAVPPFAQQ